MSKLMTILRTVFLAFIFFYALKLLPLALLVSADARRGDVMVPFTKVENVASVTWLAIGWIAVETVVGWAQVWVNAKLEARAAAKASRAAAPPPAPKA
jgi:hypothetical protein